MEHSFWEVNILALCWLTKAMTYKITLWTMNYEVYGKTSVTARWIPADLVFVLSTT
jgi:hypothetical protein